jgi:hypothetical protein
MAVERRAPALALVLLLAALRPASPQTQGAATAGGLRWKVPATWTEERGSAMRVATYKVPGAGPDAAGECAVFFFGPGQGGSVDANLERWSRQFEGNPKPERSERRVNDLPVTVARLAGTYLAPGGPSMQSQGKRPGYRLLGAIVEAPEGLVFFKLTGPAATIRAAERGFETLVASFSRSAPARS